MKRLRLRHALVGWAFFLPAACEDADTIIAVYAPPAAEPDAEPMLEAGSDAPIPDAEMPEADVPDVVAPQPAPFYLEAESGVLSGPFAIGMSDAASGGQFIAGTEAGPGDMPGTGRALYTFTIEEAGDFVIWGRIHSPDALNNRFWVRVDEGQWYLWRISTGEAWYWDDFHDNTDYNVPITFALAAGEHRLELANAVTGAELDRLYVTARNEEPPGNETSLCNPPHTIELAGGCVRSCGSYGPVSCLSEVCMGLPELEAYDCPVCCLPP